MYKAGIWRNALRVIVKIEVGELGPNVRFIVTNFNGPRKDIHETGYCARGAMELMIKELKTYLHADRMSCNSFSANQFRLFLHAAAYVLLHSMQHILLADTDFEKYSMLTLVTKLMFSAVRVEVRSAASACISSRGTSSENSSNGRYAWPDRIPHLHRRPPYFSERQIVLEMDSARRPLPKAGKTLLKLS